MNKSTLKQVVKFTGLILSQVLICNQINFLGSINPYIYIIFIFLYPINSNRYLFILLSFLLGLCIDIFSDSVGANATACVTLAFVRPLILRASFKILYEHQTLKISNTKLSDLFTYITICTIFHHLILFSLEVFNVSNLILILKKTLFSGIFTILLSSILIHLFSRNKK